MYSVIAERVSKAYGDNVALDGVDLTIPDGGVVALLGPNGAGKTSLVEILEGHRQRTSGALSVLGRDPGDHDDFAVLRTQIGVVLQHTMLEQNVSSRDLLRRQASYYASPVSIDRLLDDVELTDKQHAQVRTLSGGMKRRLDIALALVGRPKLLFLDEPSTGLDPVSRRGVHALVRLANAEGTTVILTSHDLEEVQELVDTVHVIRSGRFIASGTPRSLIAASGAKTTVEFQLAGTDARDMPAGAEVRDGVARYLTDDQDALLTRLRGWSASSGRDLTGLAIMPPRLEEAYIRLVESEADLVKGSVR